MICLVSIFLYMWSWSDMATIHTPCFILNTESFSKKHQKIYYTDKTIIYYLSLLQYVHANITLLLQMSIQHKTAHRLVIQWEQHIIACIFLPFCCLWASSWLPVSLLHHHHHHHLSFFSLYHMFLFLCLSVPANQKLNIMRFLSAKHKTENISEY